MFESGYYVTPKARTSNKQKTLLTPCQNRAIMRLLTRCQYCVKSWEDNMPKRETPGVREEEILNACEKLYGKMHFRDVTIKQISAGNVLLASVDLQLFSDEGGDLSAAV